MARFLSSMEPEKVAARREELHRLLGPVNGYAEVGEAGEAE
jgi:hypothetical protein